MRAAVRSPIRGRYVLCIGAALTAGGTLQRRISLNQTFRSGDRPRAYGRSAHSPARTTAGHLVQSLLRSSCPETISSQGGSVRSYSRSSADHLAPTGRTCRLRPGTERCGSEVRGGPRAPVK